MLRALDCRFGMADRWPFGVDGQQCRGKSGLLSAQISIGVGDGLLRATVTLFRRNMSGVSGLVLFPRELDHVLYVPVASDR